MSIVRNLVGRPLRKASHVLARASVIARRKLSSARSSAARATEPPGAPAEMPLISVIVPLYNDPEYIGAALASLLSQSYRNIEIIVVDDASTDRSPDIVQDFARRHDRMSFLRHEKNRGLSAARNTGLKAARGRAVAFLDSDDLLYPQSIWDRWEALKPHVQDGAVAGSYCRIHSVPQRGDRWAGRLLQMAHAPMPIVTFLTRDGECPFPAHAPLLKRNVLVALGGFDETMTSGCEDWDLWQRMLRRGYVVVPSPTIGGAYRARSGSMRLRAPLAHTRMALELLARAEQPAAIASVDQSHSLASEYPGDEPVSSWPCPLTAPLSTYRLQRLGLLRVVRSAALAALNGNREEELASFALLQDRIPAWVLWSVDVPQEIRSAVQLGLGFDGSRLAASRRNTEEIVKRISDRLRARLGASCTSPDGLEP